MKKILFTFFVLACCAIAAHSPTIVRAQTAANATMVLQGMPTSIGKQQEFSVDVAINPNGGDYNGIQGNVTFSNDTLAFVRAETGTSILNYFITPPTLTGDTINFSGIVLGGFEGLINPFDQGHVLPGTVVKLIFVGKAAGIATIGTNNVSVTENDGFGTLQTVANTSASLTVSNTVAVSTYTTHDTTPPTITASVVQIPELFNDNYVLVFNATDKQSGIDHVTLQEGIDQPVTIQSPYMLHDQSRHSILVLRAYDVAGNVTVITIPATGSSRQIAVIVLLIIVTIILYAIHKKAKHPEHLV